MFEAINETLDEEEKRLSRIREFLLAEVRAAEDKQCDRKKKFDALFSAYTTLVFREGGVVVNLKKRG